MYFKMSDFTDTEKMSETLNDEKNEWVVQKPKRSFTKHFKNDNNIKGFSGKSETVVNSGNYNNKHFYKNSDRTFRNNYKNNSDNTSCSTNDSGKDFTVISNITFDESKNCYNLHYSRKNDKGFETQGKNKNHFLYKYRYDINNQFLTSLNFDSDVYVYENEMDKIVGLSQQKEIFRISRYLIFDAQNSKRGYSNYDILKDILDISFSKFMYVMKEKFGITSSIEIKNSEEHCMTLQKFIFLVISISMHNIIKTNKGEMFKTFATFMIDKSICEISDITKFQHKYNFIYDATWSFSDKIIECLINIECYSDISSKKDSDVHQALSKRKAMLVDERKMTRDANERHDRCVVLLNQAIKKTEVKRAIDSIKSKATDDEKIALFEQINARNKELGEKILEKIGDELYPKKSEDYAEDEFEAFEFFDDDV